MVQQYISEAIKEHRLPEDFSVSVERYYQPLAAKISSACRSQPGCYLLGVQGSQGSGKSTLADFLKRILEQEHCLTCVSLSIDDFYLTRQQRQALASNTHPLLCTRGVPGTHDVELLESTIARISSLGEGEQCAITRFNKAIDDRADEHDWSSVKGPVDVIILEGWCVGIGPESETSLSHPINELEQQEDSNGIWRHFVNQRLSLEYAELYSKLDGLLVLQAPSFNCVYQWRSLQEQKLEQKWKKLPPEEQGYNRLLSPKELERFISHYQRLTEHGLSTLPQRADWLLSLDEAHNITGLKEKKTHA